MRWPLTEVLTGRRTEPDDTDDAGDAGTLDAEAPPACGCHPAYHELGVHAPGWRPGDVTGRSR
ncbi:MAG: hypothetical protein ACTHNS_15720 [Marmoricola sp.]